MTFTSGYGRASIHRKHLCPFQSRLRNRFVVDRDFFTSSLLFLLFFLLSLSPSFYFFFSLSSRYADRPVNEESNLATSDEKSETRKTAVAQRACPSDLGWPRSKREHNVAVNVDAGALDGAAASGREGNGWRILTIIFHPDPDPIPLIFPVARPRGGGRNDYARIGRVPLRLPRMAPTETVSTVMTLISSTDLT